VAVTESALPGVEVAKRLRPGFERETCSAACRRVQPRRWIVPYREHRFRPPNRAAHVASTYGEGASVAGWRTSMSASTGVSSDRSGANDLDAVAACRSTRLGSVGEPTDNAVWQVVAVGMSDLPQLAVGPALDLGNEAAAACTNGGDDQGAAG